MVSIDQRPFRLFLVQVSVCACVYTCMRAFVYMRACARARARARVCVCVCMCVCVCVCKFWECDQNRKYSVLCATAKHGTCFATTRSKEKGNQKMKRDR